MATPSCSRRCTCARRARWGPRRERCSWPRRRCCRSRSSRHPRRPSPRSRPRRGWRCPASPSGRPLPFSYLCSPVFFCGPEAFSSGNSPVPNRLAKETSPFLQQHAENPVDWYPWGQEALEAAKASGKPILLSVGYSACHWCHVMAHESFENPEIAKVMNDLFVNIKVDREERPAIDQIYQVAQVMLTQRNGGWPLTMFLTADQLPFFGGTYFPDQPKYGMPGFADLLKRVREFYDQHPDDIRAQGEQLAQALARTTPRPASHPSQFSRAPLDDAEAYFASAFDRDRGGLTGAPKFPHPDSLELLLRRFAAAGDRGREAPVRNNTSLDLATLTLRKMAQGGIYDQVGG